MANDEIVFIDTSTEVKETLEKLSRSALRAAGREIGKHLKSNTKVRTQNLKNHIGFWAKIDKYTGQPELQVGYYSWQKVKKKGKRPSRSNPMWFEFGVNAHAINIKKAQTLSDGIIDYGKSVNHPGLKDEHILRNSVYDNIDSIRNAQEKYLSELNKTIEEASRLIEESEEDESV